MLETILEQIFPTTCGICGKINKESLCKKCRANLNKKLICKTQYKYINGEFIKYMYLFKYEEELRKIMLSYKFKEKIYLYEFFVKIILKNEKLYKFLEKYDIIIPVPLHNKKLKYRGYNQCELITSGIAKNVENLQSYSNILVKTRNTPRQSSLASEQRKMNVQGAYKIKNLEKNKLEVRGKNILLFDDICTTMSTVIECTKVLQELKPQKIGILTIFKD